MSESLLSCVEIDPPGDVRCSVLWLHGLGADGHDFEPIVPHLGLPEQLGVRFVFPNAPQRPVTINNGWVMPAWYDIAAPSLDRDQDEAGILESAAAIDALVEREQRLGVDASRIVLAGFSQGGAVAMLTALRMESRPAGLLALSTYLVMERSLAENHGEHGAALPVFCAHGTADPMVPLERGQHARACLESWGYDVDWRTYPMGHEVSAQEIADVGAWLGKTLEQATSLD